MSAAAAEYSLYSGCAWCGAVHEHLRVDGDDLVCSLGHGCAYVAPTPAAAKRTTRGRKRTVRATVAAAPTPPRATLHDGVAACACGRTEGDGALVWWTLVRGTLALQCPGCGDLGGAR